MFLSKIKNGFNLIRKSGLKEFFRVLSVLLSFKFEKIRILKFKKFWLQRHDFFLDRKAFGNYDYLFQEQYFFPKNIKFSILVPLYNTPIEFLQEMLGSVFFQTYQNWELCLADGSDDKHNYVEKICSNLAEKDKRIKYLRLIDNKGISENTNKCLEMATGDYISLFDHDDLLHPSALFETMKAICEQDAEFIYTDEVVFQSPDLHKILHVHFKNDFNQELLETNNYICHFTSFKKSLLGNHKFDKNCDGAQDFDIILKVTEKTNKIVHIKQCLYYWRASPASTASSSSAKSYTTDAGKLALVNHFKRIKKDVIVNNYKYPNTYKITYTNRENFSNITSDESFLLRKEYIF